MRVFVAIAIDIHPDVRLDAGGGEIGSERLLGVAATRELAIQLARQDVDKLLAEIRAWQDDEWETWEDITDFVDYSLRYNIQETEVLVRVDRNRNLERE